MRRRSPAPENDVGRSPELDKAATPSHVRPSTALSNVRPSCDLTRHQNPFGLETLPTSSSSQRSVWAEIDREVRKEPPTPSDHAPVVIHLNEQGNSGLSPAPTKTVIP